MNWYDDVEETAGRSRNDLRNASIEGAARSPLELIVNVIRKDRPFSEILTADYTMVNPYSSRSYGLDISGFSFPNDGLSANYSVDDYREVRLAGIPHTGILNDPIFLTQFPTTATNLNRHRSTKIQLFFLNTDILSLANRPIDSTEESDDPHPNMTDPDCTICHIVMEPIAGAYKNYQRGVRYEVRNWTADMYTPGFSINKPLPDEEQATALQWLAQEIVKDERFARSIVHIFYTALTGREPLRPSTSGTPDAPEYIQAINFEDEVFIALTQKFVNANMNAKVLIKEIVKSPLYRGVALPSGEYNSVVNSNIGLSKLITPENLDEKIKSTMGYYWIGNTTYFSEDDRQDKEDTRHLLLNAYRILYGGMDSLSVTQRTGDLNGVMAGIQMRLASEMSCRITPIDFSFAPNERKLFPLVDKELEPIDAASIAKIKENIQYLFKHFLNEDVALNSQEMSLVYDLFYETYVAGKANVSSASESAFLRCTMSRDPITGASLSSDMQIRRDDSYVIRSWAVVIAFMLSDYKFLYDNTAQFVIAHF